MIKKLTRMNNVKEIYMRYMNCFFVCCLYIFLFNSCQNNEAKDSYSKIESKRTLLINGIESYQNFDEFTQFMKKNNMNWEASFPNKDDERNVPPLKITTVTIKDFNHYSFSGELTIILSNDRLSHTIFYPIDFDNYVTALMKAENIYFEKKKEPKIQPFTHIRTGTDYRGKKYVIWFDERLETEVNEWIRKYS